MAKIRSKQIQSSLLLLLAAIVWGAAFVAQSLASNTVGTFTFNGIRFIIGGICLLPFLKGHNVRPSSSIIICHSRLLKLLRIYWPPKVCLNKFIKVVLCNYSNAVTMEYYGILKRFLQYLFHSGNTMEDLSFKISSPNS